MLVLQRRTRAFRALRFALALLIGPASVGFGAFIVERRDCNGQNDVRDAVVKLVDYVGQGRPTLIAAINSPLVTPEQKVVARQRLTQLDDFLKKGHEALKHQSC